MSWIKNIFLILASTVVSLFILEIGLRVIYPTKVDVQVRDHSDPLLPKHLSGTHIHQIRNSIATFDNSGMRVNPIQCEQGKTVNTLLVGDSNIAGLFLNDSETLGAKITEQSLENELCINVDTFGVSGFGPDQTLFAIEHLTKKKIYDFVIFHIFADNDLGDLIRNNNYVNDRLINPGYCFAQRSLLEGFLTYKVTRKALYVFGIDINLYGTAVSSNGLDNNCMIVPHPNFENFAASLHARAKLDWQVNRRNQRQIYMGDKYDIEFACNSNEEVRIYANQYLNRVILEASEIANQRKFKLVYLIQPSEIDVTNNHPERLDKGCDQYSPKNLSQFFVKALSGLSYINLYKSFLNCNTCYFTKEELGSDNHWSPYGVNLAASNLVQFITQNTSQ